MAPRLAPDVEPIPGYRLIERLGRGGFGEVWKCEAPGGMFKAIKFVYGNLDEATENGKPAEQELKALHRVKTIRHPYILSLERFDIIEGQLLIVMELADRNLYDRFRECRDQGLPGIPRAELLEYMEETAEALDLMNAQFQLQHLDIKPQNIFLVFAHVKVADFGLAKDLEGMQATLTGGVTPVYAAPETFECRVTRFCDQYSLAIVYQEMLTGERPFSGSTARQLMMQHITTAPDLNPLPPTDRAIIGRALNKKPETRFPTCADMVRALREAGREPEVVAPPEQTPLPPGTIMSRSSAGALSPPARRSGDMPSMVGLSLRGNTEQLPSLSGRVKLPPLTAGRTLPANAALANARPAPPERCGEGVIFPAVVIGLGQFGLQVLQRFRRAVRDRFGTVSLPHLRLLYIDSDADAQQAAGTSTTALEPEEIFLAKMNRPAHYKTREDLPDIGTWLNPQLLYRIPRQPATTGIRAFGRLALCDHYRSLTQKLRAEIEASESISALDQTAARTGLALRTNRPRVYIVTSLMGGTGSGMFLDLAYVVRFHLRLLGYSEPEVHGILFAPPVGPDTPRTPGVANTYAALTELFHYSAPNTTYEAQFDTKEGPIADRERPFQRCLLLPLPKSGEGSMLRPALGVGVGFLMQEMFTPAGREADGLRAEKQAVTGETTPVQTCGSYRFSWPRRGLLERSARRCCERVLADWTARESNHLGEPVREWLEEQWNVRHFGPEAVRAQLEQACHEAFGGEPIAALDATAALLDDRRRRSEIDVDDLCVAIERLTQLVGPPEGANSATTGRLPQKLEQQVRAIADAAAQQFQEMVDDLVDAPTWRLAGAEELTRQYTDRLRRTLEKLEPIALKMRQDSVEEYVKMLSQSSAVEAMSRGSRKAAAVREVAALMRLYARKRYDFLLHRSVAEVFRQMVTAAPEFQRELQQARQQLDDLRELFLRHSTTGGVGYLGAEQPLLPPGCKSLDEAADRLASVLPAEDIAALDHALHTSVCAKYGGLLAFCRLPVDQVRAQAEVLLAGARPYVEPRLGPGNAAAAFLATYRDPQDAANELGRAFDEAYPELAGTRGRPDQQIVMLAVPADEYGQRLASLAREALGGGTFNAVTGADDVVLIREYQFPSADELPQLSSKAREAFLHVTNSDQAAPHSRNDVAWRAASREQ